MTIIISADVAYRLRKHAAFQEIDLRPVPGNCYEFDLSHETVERLLAVRIEGETLPMVIDRLLDYAEGRKPS